MCPLYAKSLNDHRKSSYEISLAKQQYKKRNVRDILITEDSLTINVLFLCVANHHEYHLQHQEEPMFTYTLYLFS